MITRSLPTDPVKSWKKILKIFGAFSDPIDMFKQNKIWLCILYSTQKSDTDTAVVELRKYFSNLFLRHGLFGDNLLPKLLLSTFLIFWFPRLSLPFDSFISPMFRCIVLLVLVKFSVHWAFIFNPLIIDIYGKTCTNIVTILIELNWQTHVKKWEKIIERNITFGANGRLFSIWQLDTKNECMLWMPFLTLSYQYLSPERNSNLGLRVSVYLNLTHY